MLFSSAPVRNPVEVGPVRARESAVNPRRAPLVVGRVETAEELAALERDWLALERSSGNVLPFRTFTWVACWWKHLHAERLAVRDSLAIRTVRTAEGRLVGVAPLMLTERPCVGPVRARCLQSIGADPYLTEVRGPLCLPELEPECYGAIQSDLALSAPDVDWVRWSGVDDGRGGREALDGTAIQWEEDVVCCVLKLPATWRELRSSMSRNLRQSLRSCYNAPRRDGLDVSFEVLTKRVDAASALEDLFRLHAARIEASKTVLAEDALDFPGCRAFLVDVCERFAERDALRVFRLRVGGVLVATRVGFVLGDGLYLYYSGFDPAYAKYGVMTTTAAEAIKYAISQGLRSANLSTGLDPWKMRWRPKQVNFHEGLLVTPRLLGRAKYAALAAATRATRRRGVREYARRLLARNASVPA
jgi:CelD/BcsL family acetyltransferase involved in cellulose biosynthesis